MITLVMTYHDPQERMVTQAERVLPTLQSAFDAIVVNASRATSPTALALWQSNDATVMQQNRVKNTLDSAKLGKARRDGVAQALSIGADWVFYCDCDRMLHWADTHPDELATLRDTIPNADFTIYGRTPDAFASHPRAMQATEAIVNHTFQLATRNAWDMLACARGISRAAAQAIVDQSADDDISNDVTWYFLLRDLGRFRVAYHECDGLAYETADRYGPEVEAAGGDAAWLAALDADPHQWAGRLAVAHLDVAAMRPYFDGSD